MSTRRHFGLSLAACALLPSVAFAQSEGTHLNIAYGAHRLQKYDAYLPSRSQQNGAAVVFLHGGGWRVGDKRNKAVWQAKSQHWTGQGLSFFSVNTRLLPDADPVGQLRDLADALAHIQAHADSYGIAPDRIVLMGHSAGGHLVGLLGATPSFARSRGAQPWRGTVVLDSAALNLEAKMAASPARLYKEAFGDDPAFWKKMSPLAQLESGAPPFLVVCSSNRRMVCPEARQFATAVKGKARGAEVLPVPLSHRDINLTLGQPGALTTLVDAFLHERLGM